MNHTDHPALVDFRLAVVSENRCPECLGRLDGHWTCRRCGYDAYGEVLAYEASTREDGER